LKLKHQLNFVNFARPAS